MVEFVDFGPPVKNLDGSPGPIERTSLRATIDSDLVLRPFANLPSKANGVEAQGLAVEGDDIYVGFRSPVLRDNFVPVMRTRFGRQAAEVEITSARQS